MRVSSSAWAGDPATGALATPTARIHEPRRARPQVATMQAVSLCQRANALELLRARCYLWQAVAEYERVPCSAGAGDLATERVRCRPPGFMSLERASHG